MKRKYPATPLTDTELAMKAAVESCKPDAETVLLGLFNDLMCTADDTGCAEGQTVIGKAELDALAKFLGWETK